MTAYEDARARVKAFLHSWDADVEQPEVHLAGARDGSVLKLTDIRILAQVPESPVVNLVSDDTRRMTPPTAARPPTAPPPSTNHTGIRLDSLEKMVQTHADEIDDADTAIGLLARRVYDLERSVTGIGPRVGQNAAATDALNRRVGILENPPKLPRPSFVHEQECALAGQTPPVMRGSTLTFDGVPIARCTCPEYPL